MINYVEVGKRSHLKDMLCAIHLCTQRTRLFGVKLSVLLTAALVASLAVLHYGHAHTAAAEGASVALIIEKCVEAVGEALAEVVE